MNARDGSVVANLSLRPVQPFHTLLPIHAFDAHETAVASFSFSD